MVSAWWIWLDLSRMATIVDLGVSVDGSGESRDAAAQGHPGPRQGRPDLLSDLRFPYRLRSQILCAGVLRQRGGNCLFSKKNDAYFMIIQR